MWCIICLCGNSNLLLTDSQKQPGPEGTLRTVIQERRLHVGVHNGWGFIEKPQVAVLEPVASGARGRSGSTSKQSTLVKDRWAEGKTHICGAVTVGYRRDGGAIFCSQTPQMCKNDFRSSYFYSISSASPGTGPFADRQVIESLSCKVSEKLYFWKG